MAQKAEALEAERLPREVEHQRAEARPPLRAVVEVALQPRLPAEVVHRPAEVVDRLRPRLPVAALHQQAQVRLRPLAADVAVPRRPVEAAVVHSQSEDFLRTPSTRFPRCRQRAAAEELSGGCLVRSRIGEALRRCQTSSTNSSPE